MNKILTLNQLPELIKQLKADRKDIVLLGGVFDLLHIGHVRFLTASKKLADISIVLLESDEKVKKRKGVQRPIHPQLERAEVLSTLVVVDYIVLLPPLTTDEEYREIVNRIKPEIITVTEGDLYLVQKSAHAQAIGAQLQVIPKIKTPSTTQLARLLEIEHD